MKQRKKNSLNAERSVSKVKFEASPETKSQHRAR